MPGPLNRLQKLPGVRDSRTKADTEEFVFNIVLWKIMKISVSTSKERNIFIPVSELVKI